MDSMERVGGGAVSDEKRGVEVEVESERNRIEALSPSFIGGKRAHFPPFSITMRSSEQPPASHLAYDEDAGPGAAEEEEEEEE